MLEVQKSSMYIREKEREREISPAAPDLNVGIKVDSIIIHIYILDKINIQ